MLITSFDLKRVMAYLEPYLLANVLAGEWQPLASKSYPYVANMEEATMLGLELFRRFGFDPYPHAGVCKIVYTHRTCVIKIPIHEAYAPITDMEIDDINTRWPDPAHKCYFPQTVPVGDGVSVQERCRPMNPDDYRRQWGAISKLVNMLGLWDVHEDNVGYSLTGEGFKFFDVQQYHHLQRLGDVQSTARRHASLLNTVDWAS